MMIVPPQSSFHCVEVSETGEVKDIIPVSKLPIWENGGFFVLSQEIFDLLPPGGDLVEDACGALAGQGRLFGYRYDGFWKPADTFKERAELDADTTAANRPWMVWEHADTSTRERPQIPDDRTFCRTQSPKSPSIGAHCDDIAIGMGGTLLTMSEAIAGITRARHGALRRRHRA